jgi:hypothetical protein
LLTLDFKIFYLSGCIFNGIKMIYDFYVAEDDNKDLQKIKKQLSPYPKELQALIIFLTIAVGIAGSWFIETYFLANKIIRKINKKGEDKNE